MYIGVCVFAIHGANLKLSLFNNFAVVVAKVIKWVEVFIAKPYIEAKNDNFVPYQPVRLFFIVPIDRSVHNTNVSYWFIHRLYQIHFGCTEKYIKFRPINAYRPKLDKHFPLYFSYLDIKFVPHYQDLIPFSPFLFLCLFSTFSNFQLCMFLPPALHYCMFSISPSLSLTISLMFSFPFFYYFLSIHDKDAKITKMHFRILAHKTLKTHYIKGAKNQIIFLSHFIAAGSWMVNTHTHTHRYIYRILFLLCWQTEDKTCLV